MTETAYAGTPGLPGPDISMQTASSQPALNRAVAIPDPRLNVATSRSRPGARVLSSYVSLEMPAEEETANHRVLQHDLPAPDFQDYVTVYSLVNETLPARVPRISVDVVRPPLVIDYRVSPLPIIDVKYVEYKTGHTQHNETFHIHRYYENSWFRVTVRDQKSGEIAGEDGVGWDYFLDDQPRQLVVRTCGNYTIEFGGEDSTIDLSIRVRNDGIVPVK